MRWAERIRNTITTSGDRRPAALRQVDGGRWITLEGVAWTTTDPGRIAEAVARYAGRYRTPRANPARVAVEIEVTRVIGSRRLLGR